LPPTKHRAGSAADGHHHHHHHHHHHATQKPGGAVDGRPAAAGTEQSDFYTFGDGLTTIKGESALRFLSILAVKNAPALSSNPCFSPSPSSLPFPPRRCPHRRRRPSQE
jgi:hypothetical protein